MTMLRKQEHVFQSAMEINCSGKYVLTEDIKGNLTIRGDDINLDGHDFTVYGWVHVTGSRIKISNLRVRPNSLIKCVNGVCEICGNVSKYKTNVSAAVGLCRAVETSIFRIEAYYKTFDSFAVVSESNTIFTDCRFRGHPFSDPPTSEHVIRY